MIESFNATLRQVLYLINDQFRDHRGSVIKPQKNKIYTLRIHILQNSVP